VKCPKCHYLGFETSERCRNCGYDFSLVHELGDAPPDVRLAALTAAAAGPLAPLPLDTVVAAPAAPPAAGTAAAPRAASRAAAPSLPLFQPGIADDEPLIKLPASPRPPLAVRRTPERPRRSPPKPIARQADVRALIPSAADAQLHLVDDAPPAIDEFRPAPRPEVKPAAVLATSPARRLSAALIDHALLLAVDAIVVYFTIKMAGLTLAEWGFLPPMPLASFLLMLKVAYFATFTLVGGQTIGKMAVRIRVIGEDGSPLDPARAFQRTVVGAVSLLAVGAGLVPLLVGSDRRGFHDRVARTRVVAVPSNRRLA
jgi:uncharacterized RDD family membrane protein YckC